MKKSLIVYASKYGSTKDAARIMGLILGPAQVVSTNDFNDKHKDFDFVVLMAPLYKGRLLTEMEEFIENNQAWLVTKPLVLVGVALDENEALKTLAEWEKRLGNMVQHVAWLGGRLKLNLLSQEDHDSLEAFANMTGYQLQDRDRFNQEKIIALALEIKKIKDGGELEIPAAEVRQSVEKYLQSHNTCTLCTSRPGHVRGTPIEYLYKDACLYMFSEGGEKFANILLNPKVSVSVYDAYQGFSKLGGLQITGMADLVSDRHPDYEQILIAKGFSVNKFSQLPVQMNLIRIRIQKAEFLWSGFAQQGHAIKQIVSFD